MNPFFDMLRYAGSEGEIILYCLYFPCLFSLVFLLDAVFILPFALKAIAEE
ncbi:MAG: hypothetical protein PHQ42_03585 [Patescibacteria group bacterium]|nr:hypothetical protein [Patescibacteria group bacterium]